jgi:pimeloyl-ACP methyl ester carboxylesterase
MPDDTLPEIPAPPPLDVQGRLVNVEGARLWAWDTGSGGEPVVLCHPASQAAEIWAYQKPAFVARGYRLIAYSRRGYGQSEKGTPDQPGTSVGDLENLLKALQVNRLHILGAAAGGITALAFAVANPERVQTVTLAGTIFSPDEAEWREVYGRLGIEAVRDAVSTEFLELGPTYRICNPGGTRRFAELSADAHRSAPARQVSGVKVNWTTMATMPAPTLLLTGDADLYAPPPLQAMIAQHLPNSEQHVMPEVGHAAYWEQPDAFNEIVLGFLDRHKSGSMS